MNTFVKHLSVGALSAVLIAGGFATTASANSVQNTSIDAEATATVQGGSLSIQDNVGIAPFESILLDGSTQTETTSVDPFSVIDATGTGSGWNLNVKADPLTSEGGSLPAGSLRISGTSVTAQEGSSEANKITIGAGNIDSTEGVKLLTASAGEGMGTFNIADTDLTLNIQPKDAMAGTYSSTVTFNLVTGP